MQGSNDSKFSFFRTKEGPIQNSFGQEFAFSKIFKTKTCWVCPIRSEEGVSILLIENYARETREKFSKTIF